MTSHANVEAYITKDGSVIRELMHPNLHGNAQISLAEALIPAGSTTRLHIHRRSEEIYHITAGAGFMTVGSESFRVVAGDTVAIPPGTAHRISNTHSSPLTILCCCSPAYSHEDTELLVENPQESALRC